MPLPGLGDPAVPRPRAFLAAVLALALAFGGLLAYAVANAPPAAPPAPTYATAPPTGGASSPPTTGGTPPVTTPTGPPMLLGTVEYDGPGTAQAMLAACQDKLDRASCALAYLEDLLLAEGAVAAFDLLADLAAQDAEMARQGHPLAHDLGRLSLDAYGTVQNALANCSYKVFAGCFHGALQEHFERLGDPQAKDLPGLCPDDNQFRQYTCLHGVGHGLMLATHNDLNGSLALCDALEGYFARGSCYGGAFMENIVGYFDSLAGVSHSHGHEHGVTDPERGPVVYLVDRARPYFPCDVVGEAYQPTCWLMQTSLILHFNAGNFQDGAAKCAGAPAAHVDSCFRSLGRDAAAYANRDPATVVQHCSHATPSGRALCIRGFVAESILNYAAPEAGLPKCAAVPDQDKGACYDELGIQGRQMLAQEGMAVVCGQAEPAWVATCRRGAGLPA